MSKGCNTCKHYKIGEMNLNSPYEFGFCLLNNDIKFESWWKINGKKKSYELLTEMICWEDTESGKILDDINIKLNEMLKVINKNGKR